MYLPGNPKIKSYQSDLLVGLDVDSFKEKPAQADSKKSEAKLEKKTVKGEKKVAKKEEKQTKESQKVAIYVDKPQNLTKTDEKKQVNTAKESISKNVVKANAEQLSLFEEEESSNYKSAKKVAEKFMAASVEVYEVFSEKKQRLSFNKKQMLKSVNEFVQALIVASELTKGEKADENKLQFALDIGWFGNLFEEADNLDSLKRLAKMRLLEVPLIFTSSVVLDIRENCEYTSKLFNALKRLFMAIYSDGEKAFEVLTKPLVTFIGKQGITLKF